MLPTLHHARTPLTSQDDSDAVTTPRYEHDGLQGGRPHLPSTARCRDCHACHNARAGTSTGTIISTSSHATIQTLADEVSITLSYKTQSHKQIFKA